jgi:hypothetical protein
MPFASYAIIQQCFYVPITEAEVDVQKDAMTADRGREAVALVMGSWLTSPSCRRLYNRRSPGCAGSGLGPLPAGCLELVPDAA